MEKTEKVCAQCGERLRAGQRKYCSGECRRRARYLRDKQRLLREEVRMRYCAQCGQAFTPRTANQKYCSKACNNRATVVRNNPQATKAGEAAICACCGQAFVRRCGNEKYCGAECRERMRKQYARQADKRNREKKRRVQHLRPGENAKAIVRAETAARAAGMSYGYSQLRRMGIV